MSSADISPSKKKKKKKKKRAWLMSLIWHHKFYHNTETAEFWCLFINVAAL